MSVGIWYGTHASSGFAYEWLNGHGGLSDSGDLHSTVVAVVMTLHKLHARDGYAYLARQVAAADEGRSPGHELSDNYTASGDPPGRWVKPRWRGA